MGMLWLVFGLKGSLTGRGDRGIRNDAVTRLVSCAMVEFHVGCLVQRSQWWILHGPEECLRAGFPGGSCSQFEESGNGMKKPPPNPRYTAAYLSSPLTKRGSFKAISPEFWRENWAMKCPPKLRKPSNSDERTWYNLSHEASLLANLCFDCTIPNKSSNSQNSRWSWHSFLELCFAYCFSFLSSGLTKDRILGWTACFAWGGSDFG